MMRLTKKMRKRRAARIKGLQEPPVLLAGQVYVTKRGRCRHDAWCSTLNGVWLAGSNAILVIDSAQARNMTPCENCEQMLTAAEWRF